MDYPQERQIDSFRSSTARWLFGSLTGWGTLLLCPVGVGLIILGVRWLQNVSSQYDVTDQRLIVRRGIFIKTVDEIELYRVKDVRLQFSLINQMTGIGTIALTSSDPSTGGGAFVLRDVPMATDRREGLRGLVERARHRRGVREFDSGMTETPALAG
jgi:uncharacterized membrane protein YdbT with pleckstrin-like domain